MSDSTSNELLSKLKAYAERVKPLLEHCDTEEQTKISLINPFIEALDHDVRDPRQVRFEYTVDLRINKEKADYAILHEGDPAILIEAKANLQSIDNPKHVFQVSSYANQMPSVKFVALTNGVMWHWFKKSSASPNQYALEDRPFLKHNVLTPTWRELSFLTSISGRRINFDQAELQAQEASLLSALGEWLHMQQNAETLDPDFIELLTRRFVGIASAKNKATAQRIWLTAFENFITKYIKDRFQKAQESDSIGIGDVAETIPEISQSEATPRIDRNETVNREIETREFETANGIEVLTGNQRRRAWRKKDSIYWQIESNGTSLLRNAIVYFASLHTNGMGDYLASIAELKPRVLSNNQAQYAVYNAKTELPMGYFLNTNINAQQKEEVLIQLAASISIHGQSQEASELIEWWL